MIRTEGVSRRIVMMGTGSMREAKAMQTPGCSDPASERKDFKKQTRAYELQKRERTRKSEKTVARAREYRVVQTRRKGKKRNLHQTRSVWAGRVIKSQPGVKTAVSPPTGRSCCMTDGLTAAAADLRQLLPSTSGSEQEALRLLFLRPSGQKPSASPAHTAPTTNTCPSHPRDTITG